MRRMSVFWGAIILLLGGMLLLQNFGLMRLDVWQLFWPAVIILFGIWLVIGATVGRRALRVENYEAPADGAQRVKLSLHYGAGVLRVGGGAPMGTVVQGTFTGGVDRKIRRQGDEIGIDLSVPAEEVFDFLPWMGQHPLDWDVHLAENLPVELVVEAGASRNELDLGKLDVSRLSFKTGASDTQIAFSSVAKQTLADVSLGAAAAKLSIPKNVAARIQVKSGLSGITIDQGRFPRLGDIYQSADYGTAEHKLDLNIEAGVGSVNVT